MNKETSVKSFDYKLPKEMIAQSPVEPRDSSRLMLLNREGAVLGHRIFKDIVDQLKEGDVLVMNNSKVFKARLQAEIIRTGTEIEAFLLRPLGDKKWEAILGNARRAQLKDVLDFGGVQGELLQKMDDGTVRLKMNVSDDVILAFCNHHGKTPLPPYITKELDDSKKYQTVYAEPLGSVAAPTAGLHFTPGLLKTLEQKGVQLEYVTLHVGLGTFRPVKVETIDEHQMHPEFVEIDGATAYRIGKAKSEGRRIVAVGTTTVRALEGAAPLSQDGFIGDVNLFIKPGFEFNIIDALITNFHLPESTLLVLVSAFVGRENILEAYRTAIKDGYRFYSFGDAMFIA